MGDPVTVGPDFGDVRFYRPTDPWGELSNFAPYPLVWDGREWPTSEHLFQALKFEDHDIQERVRAAATPWDAAQLGRDRSLPLRADWTTAKVDVMRVVLRVKFTQHAQLAELLVSTGHRRLVEHTRNDSYWGDGGGTGRNMLGTLLSELREQLREEAGHDGDRRPGSSSDQAAAE